MESNMFSDKLKADVKKRFDSNGWEDEDFKALQEIASIGYEKWQSDDLNRWDYKDMIKWVNNTYGDIAAYAVLVGKLNYQVTNGGLFQYFDNGYGGTDENATLHQKLIQFHKELGLQDLKHGKDMLEILEEAAETYSKNYRDPNRRRYGGYPDYDDFDNEEDSYVSYDKQDQKYYSFMNEWITELATFFDKGIMS